MVAPTSEEHLAVEKRLAIEIPSKTEVWKNNVLNRLYVEEDIAYMTASLISKSDSPYPTTSAVTFILGKNFILTVHDITPTSFKNFSERLQRPHEKFHTPAHLMAGLFEEIIHRVAYNSELVVSSLDEVSHDVFGFVYGYGEGRDCWEHIGGLLILRRGGLHDAIAAVVLVETENDKLRERSQK